LVIGKLHFDFVKSREWFAGALSSAPLLKRSEVDRPASPEQRIHSSRIVRRAASQETGTTTVRLYW